jgi:subtilase family serine protease
MFASNGFWGHYLVFCYSDVGRGGSACSGAPSTWSGGGGTSFAAPIMAGIQALINQQTGSNQGNPNYVYYSLAASVPSVFHATGGGDITVNCGGTVNCYLPGGHLDYGRGGRLFGTTYGGSLSVSDTQNQPAYGVQGAWNFATGIGSVDASKLAANWPRGQ